MAVDFQRLSESVTRASGLQVLVKSTGDQRAVIRESIAAEIPGLTELEKDALRDLRYRPSLKSWSVSITHTSGVGAWAAVQRPAQIGIDVETLARIQLPIVQRVTVPEETLQAPDPRFLWGAKEAYFKALEKRQPVTISALRIGKWQLKEENFWTFKGEGTASGDGFLFVRDELLITLCVVRA